ncbi:MAG: hypothetical protein J1E84_07730 [Muribaculaceae bacterium]|nr:hypothetical protein [Muribaculaceae bacterium]
MLTKKAIAEIYKKYPKRPESPDMLDIPLLFSDDLQQHNIQLTASHIIINSLDPKALFHSISTKLIHGIVDFEDHVAIVLHSSIIFLGKRDSSVNVDIKMEQPSFMERLRMLQKGNRR